MKGLVALSKTAAELDRALAACRARGIQVRYRSGTRNLEVCMERPIQGAYLSTRSYALPLRAALKNPGRSFTLRYPEGISWRGKPLACAEVALAGAPALRTRATWAQIVAALGGRIAPEIAGADLVIFAGQPPDALEAALDTALADGDRRPLICAEERIFEALVPDRLRALGERPGGRPADPRELEHLIALLTDDDPHHLAQGVALAAALDDQAVYEALLVGVRYETGRLVPSRALQGASTQALVSLLGGLDDPRAASLRAQVVDLRAPLTDLRPLARFPGLRRLSVTRSDLESLDGIGACRALERLGLRECSRLTSLDGLGAPPRLTALSAAFCSNLRDIRAVAGCAALTSLDLRNCGALTSLEGLAGCQALAKLTLTGCVRLTAASELGQLPALRSLAVDPALQAWLARQMG